METHRVDNLIQLMHTVGKRYAEKGDEYLQNIESCPYFNEFKDAYASLTIDDLKLTRDKNFFFNKDAHFTALELVNEELYNMRAIFLTAGKSMPLHDHPGMIVLGNVLQGKGISRILNIRDTSKQVRFHNMLKEGKGDVPENLKERDEGIEVEDLGVDNLKPGSGFLVYPKDMKYLHDLTVTEDMILLHAEMPNKCACFYTYSDMEGGNKEGKTTKLRMNDKLPPFPEANFKYQDYKAQ